MRILLTGATGQVGSALLHTLPPLGEVIAPVRSQLDLANPNSIRQAVRDTKPDVIVNAAAYTAVDQAEREEALAMAVNAEGPAILAEEAARLGALLVHFSTDYVFDGEKASPYVETDPTNPLNAYGRSKLAGEQAIQRSVCRNFIFRTSWVYAARGRNFLLTMLRLAREQHELRIVDDQVGAPTWCRDIAQATIALLKHPEYAASGHAGIFHLCANGFTSWYGLARHIFASPQLARLAIHAPALRPIPTDAYPTPARRPRNSRLDCGRLERLAKIRLPSWEESLEQCMTELVPGYEVGVSSPV